MSRHTTNLATRSILAHPHRVAPPGNSQHFLQIGPFGRSAVAFCKQQVTGSIPVGHPRRNLAPQRVYWDTQGP